MSTLEISIAVLFVVGLGIVLLTSEGTFLQRGKHALRVIGTTILVIAVAVLAAAVLAFASADTISEVWNSDTTDTSEDFTYEEEDFTYEEGPTVTEDGAILPETEKEWEMFCAPSSEISEADREMYCF